MKNSHTTASVYESLYNNLNPEQKKAVDTIEGPVMVIAGPGTGKTSILTLRIANIIRSTDAGPESILALTFTESGAYAMRKKLVGIIGAAAYKVKISTFHGFAQDLIKQYPERFPRIIGSSAVADIDQIQLMEKIIDEQASTGKIESLRPYGDPLYYVRPVLGEIRSMKREVIRPEDLDRIIEADEKDFAATPDLYHEKGAHKGKMKGEHVKRKERIEKNKELAVLYHAYEAALRKGKFYDFEDMLIEVVEALKDDEDFRLIVQETYQYVLADEHQDANNAQNAILELLSSFHDAPNLFIVGDEKQAIYRFQGASLENFLYFKKIYPKALLIELVHNYRSTQKILDGAHALIESNPLPDGTKRVQLTGHSQHENVPIRVYEFSKYDHEHTFVARDIQKRIAAGAAADEVAVLYRNNNDALAMAQALDVQGVAYRIESDKDLLKDNDIRKLVMILKALGNLTDDHVLSEVLFIDIFNLPIVETYKLLDEAYRNKRRLHDVVNAADKEGVFGELMSKLARWSKLGKNTSFIELFETVLKESGYVEHILAVPAAHERLATLNAFFGELRALASAKKDFRLKDFLSYIELIESHGILAKTSSAPSGEKAVRLMTAHKSKGLEFDSVYIIGAYDGHWGNATKRSFFHIPGVSGDVGGGAPSHTQDDERRLFYVALTRAKKDVSITYSRESLTGREQLPTQFVSELDPAVTDMVPAEVIAELESDMPNAVTKLAAPITRTGSTFEATQAFVTETFMRQGLSVTALNNYMKCPWTYFFINLIRLPQAETKHQMYGTAVHETLRTFFDKYRAEEDMSKADMLKLFEHNLTRMPLSVEDHDECVKKGRESLGGYYDTYKGTWVRNILTEVAVAGVHFKLEDGMDIVLRGQLDKIEFIGGVSSDKVNVVDYKTGKPQSRNKIEGLTKDSDGNYKRQLAFYKLLLDSDEKGRYAFASAELDFIEPNERGKYIKERFEICDEDVAELKSHIQNAAKDILSLAFWNSTCDEKTCEYCRLASFLQK